MAVADALHAWWYVNYARTLLVCKTSHSQQHNVLSVCAFYLFFFKFFPFRSGGDSTYGSKEKVFWLCALMCSFSGLREKAILSIRLFMKKWFLMFAMLKQLKNILCLFSQNKNKKRNKEVFYFTLTKILFLFSFLFRKCIKTL